jgi:hypothetical protein
MKMVAMVMLLVAAWVLAGTLQAQGLRDKK